MRNKTYNAEVSYEIVIEALSQEDAKRIVEESMSKEQKVCFNISVVEIPSKREQTKIDTKRGARKNRTRKFIKGKLLWWKQGTGSTIILTLKSDSALEHIEIDERLFQEFYKKTGNPVRKTIIYKNGTLKLEGD